MPGATKVTCPFTYASSVETVLSSSSTHGTPNTRRTARTQTPTTPISSFHLRPPGRVACGAGVGSTELGVVLCSAMSDTRYRRDER